MYKALKNKAQRFIGDAVAIVLSYLIFMIVIFLVGEFILALFAGAQFSVGRV